MAVSWRHASLEEGRETNWFTQRDRGHTRRKASRTHADRSHSLVEQWILLSNKSYRRVSAAVDYPRVSALTLSILIWGLNPPLDFYRSVVTLSSVEIVNPRPGLTSDG